MRGDADDYYKLLGVPRTATAAVIKQAYRELARKYHPDVNPSPSAVEKFKKLTAAHAVLGNATKKADYDRYGRTGPVVIATKLGKYTLLSQAVVGDLADIYKAKNSKGEFFALKVARNPRDNDLLEAEAKTLGHIYPPKSEEKGILRYFPRMVESLKINSGGRHLQTNIFAWLENFHTLQQVRLAFSGGLRFEHGVWMFNRILEALDFVHTQKKMVHGSLLPTHVMPYSAGAARDPYNHGVKLIDWCYAVPIGEQVRAISTEFEDMYAPEILAKKPVGPSTDIYMAAKSIIYVLGGDVLDNTLPAEVPKYLASFLKGCLLKNPASRPQDAWELHEELKTHLSKHYGPKKYFRFDMPQGA